MEVNRELEAELSVRSVYGDPSVPTIAKLRAGPDQCDIMAQVRYENALSASSLLVDDPVWRIVDNAGRVARSVLLN